MPYTIAHAGGTDTVTVDQNEQGGRWVSLGTFRFEADGGSVTLSANAFNDHVVAEAVRFVPQ